MKGNQNMLGFVTYPLKLTSRMITTAFHIPLSFSANDNIELNEPWF